MTEGVLIGAERDADHPAIADVVRAAFVGHPDDAFMVKRLPGYRPDLAGRIVYPAAFDGLGYE